MVQDDVYDGLAHTGFPRDFRTPFGMLPDNFEVQGPDRSVEAQDGLRNTDFAAIVQPAAKFDILEMGSRKLKRPPHEQRVFGNPVAVPLRVRVFQFDCLPDRPEDVFILPLHRLDEPVALQTMLDGNDEIVILPWFDYETECLPLVDRFQSRGKIHVGRHQHPQGIGIAAGNYLQEPYSIHPRHLIVRDHDRNLVMS